MKILILGGAGMLGHKLWQQYSPRHEVWLTMRSGCLEYSSYNLFDEKRVISGVDAFDFDGVVRAVADIQPDAVINCIGIIKQLKSAQDPIISISINSLFPHRLANLCRAAKARLIHISTDCVFSGRKGMYTEDDVSDAEDLYGQSKYLGEVGSEGALTLRTSIIGRELKTTSGLVEWFLSNRGGNVQGYTRAIYSGFTTLALSRIIEDVLMNHPNLNGLYQVSSEPIDKHSLLLLLREAFAADIEIEENNQVEIDRSMSSNRFRSATNFMPPSWREMIQELADDPTPYDIWRRSREK